MAKATTQDTLAVKVAARQKFIEEVLQFVGAVVFNHGTQLKYEVHNWHTYSENELKNFSGFSFYNEGSYSMHGGEMTKVWYHPGVAEPKPEHLVLHVTWHELAKCEVKKFDESLGWQRAIRPVMRNQARIAKQKEAADKRAKEKQARDAARAAELRRARADLEQNAARLGMRLS